MPIPLVIVDLAPPPTPSEPVAVLEQACTESMYRARCAVAGSSDVEAGSGAPLAVAIVSWQDEGKLRVRIEVGVRQAGRQKWMVRTISFHAEDDAVERWRAVGLTVGTLVGEAAPEVAGPPAPRDAEKQPEENTARAPLPRPATTAPAADAVESTEGTPVSSAGVWFAELGAFGASGVEDTHLRLGAYGTVGHRFAGSHVFVLGTPAYAEELGTAEGLSVGRLTLAGGAGVQVPIPWYSSTLQLRLEGLAERLHVAVEDPSTGQRDAGSHWTPGVRAGVDSIWPLGGAWSLVVGGSVWTLWNRTEVRIHGQAVSTDAPFGAGLGIGLRGELK